METSPFLLLVVYAAVMTTGLAIPLSVQRFKEVGNGPSTQSNEFYVGFLPNHSQAQTSHFLTLTITTSEPVSFNVTITYLNTKLHDVTVPAYGSVSVQLPNNLKPIPAVDTAGNLVEVNKGVLIAAPANCKISVYGINGAYGSVDTFVAASSPSYSFLNGYAYPYEYYIFSAGYHAVTTENPGFMVVAGKNITEIIYVISTTYQTKDQYAPRSLRGYPLPGSLQYVTPSLGYYNYSITLQERQTYYFLGDFKDLTGVSIKSSQPISVYSGHSCAVVLNATCDHIVEQVTPTATWGKLFFSPPIYGRADGDIYKVIAMASGTTITVTMSGAKGYISSMTYNITKGGVEELQIPQNTFITIESNKPIYVMQYQKGSGSSTLGDPSMATVAPVEQYLNSYVVVPYELANFLLPPITSSQFYLAIAVFQEFYDKNQIFVDNKTMDEANQDNDFTTNQWYPLHCFNGSAAPVCGYGAIVPITNPNISYYIKHSNPKAGLFVNLQGLNNYTSFGHSAGYEMEALQVPAFSFGAPAYTFSEGNISSTSVSVNVVKQDDLQLLETVAVNVTVSFPSPDQLPPSTNRAKPNVDFNYTATYLVFGPNDQEKLVNFTIIGNQTQQPNRQFFFNLASNVLLSPYPNATITIFDEDRVTLTSTTYMTQEGQPALVCVTKAIATASDISGVITAYPIVASNAATPLVHFKNGSYPFTLAAGLQLTCINITTYDDKVMVDPKVFSVSIELTTSTGGMVTVGNPSTAQVTIIDNSVVLFSFVTDNIPVPKNAYKTTVCLQKMGNSTETISVTVYSTPQTALPAVDFTPVQQTLTFLPSDTIKCLSIPILDNRIAFTGDKTFKVGFNTTSTTLYPKGPIPESTVTIQDQSDVRVNFTAALYVVQQSQGPAMVCIVATPSAAVPVTVIVVAGEDPVPTRASRDFSAGSYDITIPANTPPQSPICTNIPIVDNGVALQPNKTFTVTLQPPNSRVVVSPPSHVRIEDNHGGLCLSEENISSIQGTYSWPNAEPGQSVSQKCQYGSADQRITRICNGNLTWTQNASKCPTVVSYRVNQLNNQTISADNVVHITRELLDAVSHISLVADQSSSNLLVVADIIINISNFFSQNEKTVTNVVKILNSIQLWPPEVLEKNGSNIIKSFEEIVITLIQQTNFTSLINAKEYQVMLLAEKVQLELLKSSGRSFNATTANTLIKGNNTSSSVTLTASVYLPPSLFSSLNGTNVGVFFSTYTTASFFPLANASNTIFIASLVLGATVVAEGYDRKIFTNLPDPIQLVFTTPFYINSTFTCMSWNFNAAGGRGNWTSDGCITYTSSSGFGQVLCHCTHLTNFAILVDISSRISEDVMPNKAIQRALEIISFIGVSLSIVGLVLTVISLVMISKLRQKDISKYHIQLCLALISMLLVFVTGIDRTETFGGCVTVSLLIHYFTLVAVMWMGAEALLMFQKVVIVFVRITTRYIIFLSLICWLVPLVPVLVPLTISRNFHVKRNSTMGFCFISDTRVFFGAFLGPILLILLFNALTFVVVSIVLVRHLLNKTSSSLHKSCVQMLNLCGVFILFGFTWFFGILTVIKADQAFEVVFAVINSFQGFLIFIFFCALNKDARLALIEMKKDAKIALNEMLTRHHCLHFGISTRGSQARTMSPQSKLHRTKPELLKNNADINEEIKSNDPLAVYSPSDSLKKEPYELVKIQFESKVTNCATSETLESEMFTY